ncbi:hypothetical protein GXW83_24865 [Streptacidiphilus sp. PB12-B1b]|uniref:hypothetical protein n=1 Tax=Streptacidiphilus sp. PB12-B1b TaxID=2705012 RepID=UPI0015FAB4ED|nr:hypothetical protein [Streptacidiphilus sp. PB12-B1b]QMU78459.1 hypothetical protein GXW83_24865 [Streptacidiphilus sp. PB12-B1b]
MPRLIDVSDEVRAEIGDDEADRLLTGATAPDRYDCTSCRAPGDATLDPTATVLFVGEETAVLAFAHSRCIPSQVVPVAEEQLLGAVRSINQAPGEPMDAYQAPGQYAAPAPAPGPVPAQPAAVETTAAVLGVTCGLVLCKYGPHAGSPRAALVVEPTGPVGRPGSATGRDHFADLLLEHGFAQVADVNQPPAELRGWSVLMAMGQLHAVLQPSQGGSTIAWWQAHQPLQVTDAWRSAASNQGEVIMFAAPAGSIGRQPREDLLRQALDSAARRGLLLGAVLPLAGT